MYDIIIFTKTWLTSNIGTSELGVNDYLTYRYDRSRYNSFLSRSHRDLITIKINSKPILILNNYYIIEMLFVINTN